jgi:hypothetical protein
MYGLTSSARYCPLTLVSDKPLCIYIYKVGAIHESTLQILCILYLYLPTEKKGFNPPFQRELFKKFAEFKAPSFQGEANPKSKIRVTRPL